MSSNVSQKHRCAVSIPVNEKKGEISEKYCIVTSNARTKIIKSKDKKCRRLTHESQLRRKTVSLDGFVSKR